MMRDDEDDDDDDDVRARWAVFQPTAADQSGGLSEREAALLFECPHSSQSLITTSARLLCGGLVAKATSVSSKMFGSSPKGLMTE